MSVVSVLSAVVWAALSVQAAAASTSAPTLKNAPRVTRSASVNSAPATAPRAPALAAAARPKVLANFDGVSSLDSAVTNFGAEFEPPDQGLCEGNGFVVEMVNSALRVYDTHGNTLAGPTNVNAPFLEGFKQFTSDPRCQYDAATNTWFAVILFLNSTSTGSRLDIAYNTTGNPRTAWSDFKIDTTNAGAPPANGCPCFGDQPTLGIDAYNVYTTTNNFSILGPQFNGAEIYAISKADLVNHVAHAHFVHYANLMIAGAQAASVQPALTNGWAPAEYFLSSLDPNGTGDHRIGVWALTNPQLVTTGGIPRLSSVVIQSEPYAIPPAAAQRGSTSTLDSGDDRMQQTQFINGDVWGELDTAVVPAGDTTPRAGAAWFRVTPQLTGTRISSAAMTAQGYVAVPWNYVLYPAIQVDGSGHGAMVLSLTGAHRFASTALALLTGGGTGFSQPVVTAAGTGPYDPAATRWGDYSWAVLDPATDSVWTATEYVPPSSSQTTDGLRNWGTRVVGVSFA